MTDLTHADDHNSLDVRERLRMAMKIVEKSPVVLFRRLPAPDAKLVYVSENIALTGYTSEEFLEERIRFADIVHPDDRARIRAEIESYAHQDIGDYTQCYRIVTRRGDTRWVEDTTTTERDVDGRIVHYQGIVVDITERKLAEEELSRSEAKFRRILETTAEGFLMMDEKWRIIEVNDAYCRMLGYERQELIGKQPFSMGTEAFKRFLTTHAAARLINSKVRVFEGTYLAKDGHQVPVLIHGNTLFDDDGRQLGHVAFVTDLTEQKRSLLLAGEVQKSLLPRQPPQMAGLDVAGMSIPCEEIGGDYFDYLKQPRVSGPGDDLLAVAVADIAGHGIDSALLMATARSAMRDRFAAPGRLDEIVDELNRFLLEDFSTTDRFMTLFALQVDRHNRELRWVRAGHDPALVYHPDTGRFEELGGAGLPLGISEGWSVTVGCSADLPCGAIVAVGTDGVWETRNVRGEMFGKERFKDLIRQAADRTAEEIVQQVKAALFEFTGGLKPEDDITLVIIKIVAHN
jgi:sigma-B regulation protein RsbU (phosphoserine phosphatase)